jgi:hypothetical protein
MYITLYCRAEATRNYCCQFDSFCIVEQKLPEIIVSLISKELPAFHAQFCVPAVRVVTKAWCKTFGKSEGVNYHKN